MKTQNYTLFNLLYRSMKHSLILLSMTCFIFINNTMINNHAYGYITDKKQIIVIKDHIEKSYQEFMRKLDEKIFKLKRIAHVVYNQYLDRDQIDLDPAFEKIYQGFMDGMDKHSNYFKKQDVITRNKLQGSSFGGIGVKITQAKSPLDYPVILDVIKDGPSFISGMIEPKDKIMSVDDKSVQGAKQVELLQALRGPVKSKINLKIIKTNQKDKVIDVQLIRAKYDNKSIIHNMISNEKILHVNIYTFHDKTGEEFVKIINENKAQNPDLRGLILDLRHNQGGTVSSALKIADALLDSGKILIIRSLVEEITFTAEKGDLLDGKPIIVLIGPATASSSEILVAALKDNNRAKLAGTRTFGKGVIQGILEMKDGSSIHITTSKFFSPKDYQIQAYGILPDVTVFPREVTKKDIDHVREADIETRFSDIMVLPKKKSIEDSDLSQYFMRDQVIIVAIDLINDYWNHHDMSQNEMYLPATRPEDIEQLPASIEE